jgi:hypothetical protein
MIIEREANSRVMVASTRSSSEGLLASIDHQGGASLVTRETRRERERRQAMVEVKNELASPSKRC